MIKVLLLALQMRNSKQTELEKNISPHVDQEEN